MPEPTDSPTDFDAALRALAKNRFVERLWQRDGTLFAHADGDLATARAARDGMGWLYGTQALRDAVDGLAVLARVVERQRYDRVVVVAPAPIAAWCDAVGRHLKGKRGLPLVALWGTRPVDLGAALDGGRANKPLWVLVATADAPTDACRGYAALRSHGVRPDDCVAIAPAGSALQRLAATEAFRDVFPLPADVGARFAALSLATLVPAALAGVVLHDALARAEDLFDQGRDPEPALNPGVRLGAWLWAMGHERRHLWLSFSKDCRWFSTWVAHIAAVPGARTLWPVPVSRLAAGAGQWAERAPHGALLAVSTFAHPDDPVAEAARAAGVPDEAFVLPEVSDWWAEAVRWQFAMAAWGHLDRCNPFAAQGQARDVLATTTPTEMSLASMAELPDALSAQLHGLGAGDRLAVSVAWPATPETQQRLQALLDALGRATPAAVVVTGLDRWPTATVGPLAAGAQGLAVAVHGEVEDAAAVAWLSAAAAHGWRCTRGFLAGPPQPA
ncbi:MAG: hypothetical protein FJ100_05345 [Deltaproteobacteria bacterium]|nr:hypothetical protein [Deltaproteobacteria bacterium]